MIDYERYFKMAMTANQYGIRLESADGHRWIMEDEEREIYFDGYDSPPTTLSEHLAFHDIQVNSKIYGGFTDALEVLHKAMLMAGSKDGLLREWDEWDIGDGQYHNNNSRISIRPTEHGIS